MEKSQLLNDKYKKLNIRAIGNGSSGKIILCQRDMSQNQQNQMDEENIDPNLNFKALNIQNQPQKESQYIVLKKFFNINMRDNKGLSPDQIREIKFMQTLRHPNVIKLIDVFTQYKQYGNETKTMYLYIAMELYLDLSSCRYNELELLEKKCIMKQILEGLNYLHNNHILHRDIKPGNIYISKDGTVIIGDLGLSRQIGSPNRELSGNVVTRIYRSPEILYGAKLYGESVDMWSVGCTFAELFMKTQKPLFESQSEIEQLQKIFQIRGTPNQQNWPDCDKLPNYMEFEHRDPQQLTKLIPDMPPQLAEIIDQLLSLDPRKRPSCSQILKHPFFQDVPSKENTNLSKKLCLWYETRLQQYLNQKK